MPPPKGNTASTIGLLVTLFLVVILPAGMIVMGVRGIVYQDFMFRSRYGGSAHFSGIPAMVFSSAWIFLGLAAWRFCWIVARGPGSIRDDGLLKAILIGVAFALGGGALFWAVSPL